MTTIQKTAPQSLTLFEPHNAQSDLSIEIASLSGSSGELVRLVQSAITGATIRSGISEDVVMFTTALSAELEFVAQAYCGGVNTKEMVWDECMDFVVSRFGLLNISEIRHAFRLAASGELGDLNLKAFYGAFTVSMLGDVLNKYWSHRQSIYNLARRVESAQLMVSSQSEKRNNYDVEAFKVNRKKFLLLLDSPTVDQVTVYDYQFLSEMGEIDLSPDEKWLVFDRAKPLVIRDLTNELGQLGQFRGKHLIKRIEDAKKGSPCEDFLASQRSIAQRLSVLDWIASKRN